MISRNAAALQVGCQLLIKYLRLSSKAQQRERMRCDDRATVPPDTKYDHNIGYVPRQPTQDKGWSNNNNLPEYKTALNAVVALC